jgi:hypothetical protein
MAIRFAHELNGSDSARTAEPTARSGSADSRRTRVSRLFGSLLMAATVVPSAGCSFWSGIQRNLTRQEGLDDFMVSYRNSAWAARAWHCSRENYSNHCYLSDLEAGFRQGYEDVAAGGTGCLPLVCPQSYWGWQYQSADGQNRMNAWFEGYPLGVKAAEQDGIAHWGAVGTSLAPLPSTGHGMNASGYGAGGSGHASAGAPMPTTNLDTATMSSLLPGESEIVTEELPEPPQGGVPTERYYEPIPLNAGQTKGGPSISEPGTTRLPSGRPRRLPADGAQPVPEPEN